MECYGSYGYRDDDGGWEEGASTDLAVLPESPNTHFCCEACERIGAQPAAATPAGARALSTAEPPAVDIARGRPFFRDAAATGTCHRTEPAARPPPTSHSHLFPHRASIATRAPSP